METSLGSNMEISQQHSQKIEDLAGKLSFLLHPTIVDGDVLTHGHEFTIGNSKYSLDLGIDGGDEDLIKNLESKHPGVLKLALVKAMGNNKDLTSKMSDLGMSFHKMAGGAVNNFLQ